MRTVITISLNGIAYQLEAVGYEALRAYLQVAEQALAGNPDQREILADLEQAIADKCLRYLGPHKNVVSSEEINEVLREMGPVDGGAEEGARQAGAGSGRVGASGGHGAGVGGVGAGAGAGAGVGGVGAGTGPGAGVSGVGAGAAGTGGFASGAGPGASASDPGTANADGMSSDGSGSDYFGTAGDWNTSGSPGGYGAAGVGAAGATNSDGSNASTGSGGDPSVVPALEVVLAPAIVPPVGREPAAPPQRAQPGASTRSAKAQ